MNKLYIACLIMISNSVKADSDTSGLFPQHPVRKQQQDLPIVRLFNCSGQLVPTGKPDICGKVEVTILTF